MRLFSGVFQKTLVVCLLALVCPLGHATAPLSLHFEKVNINAITAIEQDHQGYIWLGGQEGLMRYDGYHSTLYRNDPVDPGSLSTSWINTLKIDKQGRLWIGTRGGLNFYDAMHDRFIRYQPKATKTNDTRILDVKKIIEDDQGILWLATINDGLQRFDPGTGKFAAMRNDPNDARSLVDNRVNSIARDARGRIWVGTDAGLDCLEPGATGFIHYRLDTAAHPDADHNYVQTLFVDNNQTLWIGTSVGLEAWRMNDGSLQRRRFGVKEGLKRNWITQLYQDRQGTLWVGTYRYGLLRWEPDSQHFSAFQDVLSDPNSMAGNRISALYQDRTDILWVGTWFYATSKLDLTSGHFRKYGQNLGKSNAPPNNKITSILNASNGRIWAATLGGGLNLMNIATGESIPFRRNSGEMEDEMIGLAADKQGMFWVASRAGLARFNPRSRRYEPRAAITGEPSGSNIRNLKIDNAGTLWVMSSDGLYRMDTNVHAWHRYHSQDGNSDSLQNNNVYTALTDRHGYVWIGTSTGIERLDQTTGKITSFESGSGQLDVQGSGTVSTIIEDTNGILWAGNDIGLNRIDIDGQGIPHFHFYRTGSPVDGILEDTDKQLWISTDVGICRLNTITGRMKYFTESDGTIREGYYSDSALRSDDGTFYFGSVNGLTAFRPEEIHDNPTPPQVLITDFQVFNKSVGIGQKSDGNLLEARIQDTKSLTLPSYDSVFSIEFAALHFADPLRNKYAYQLQGFDKNWVTTDADRRLVTYMNLDPGHYQFHVRAANKDGVWNNADTTLDITILPPLWKTWWFRILVAMTMSISAWLAYRKRTRSLIWQKDKLEQQIKLRTVEVEQQKALVEQKNMSLENANRELASANEALAIANHIQEEHQSELTRFLAVASHDLRQPMHSLNIYLGALSDKDVSEPARPILNNVRKCAHIMDDMFLALLDLSRLDARITQPHVGKFPISNLLCRLEVEYAPQAAAKGLTMKIEPCNAWIESDIGLLQQLLANLLANAVRYTETGTINVTCNAAENRVNVAVRDTGIGISPHQQKTVFEEFRQLNESVRERNKGLGLGLAIVKRLCKLLDIPIMLASELGRGSTFTIQIPLVENQSTGIAAIPIAKIPNLKILRNKLVLIVEDEISILDATRVVLEQWGCTVVTALSGDEALEKMCDSPRVPDALICDYRLRNSESGTQVIELIRAEFNHDIPALLVTGDTEQRFMQKTQSSGLPMLFKPLQAETLREALIRLLEGDANPIMHQIDQETTP